MKRCGVQRCQGVAMRRGQGRDWGQPPGQAQQACSARDKLPRGLLERIRPTLVDVLVAVVIVLVSRSPIAARPAEVLPEAELTATLPPAGGAELEALRAAPDPLAALVRGGRERRRHGLMLDRLSSVRGGRGVGGRGRGKNWGGRRRGRSSVR
jgi:hypothetical protein